MYTAINLNALREKCIGSPLQPPFPHQIEAFTKLGETFEPGSKTSASGILVLPTGAGKTLTAVRWLSNHVIPKNIKILWLAPSFHLLDQAFETFYENAREIAGEKKL